MSRRHMILLISSSYLANNLYSYVLVKPNKRQPPEVQNFLELKLAVIESLT